MTCVVYKDIWSKKNLKSPGEVAISSGKKFIFYCSVCDHDYEQRPADKTRGSGCSFCSGHKICGVLNCLFCFPKSCRVYKDIWSKKNLKPSEEIAINSNKNYWFRCESCQHEYEQRPADKTRGNGCPFCNNFGGKICGSLECKFCLAKSCYIYKDIWSDKNKKKPETVSISNGEKYTFDCKICNHDYEQTPDSKSGCPYCSKFGGKICGTLDCKFCLEKSCYVYIDIWSDKNNLKPEDVAISSSKKYIFNCGECKDEYNQTPASKTNGRGCPYCVNKTEKKVATYLREININFVQQYKIGDVNKFYDFYLPDHKLIVEVDGRQHFLQVSNWESPGENLENDIKKMKMVFVKGISVLRIYQPDIWSDKIDWKSCIKDNLYTRLSPTVVYISDDPEIYNNHKVAHPIRDLPI